jgi:hypothetical protein
MVKIDPGNVMTWPRYGDVERFGDDGATFARFVRLADPRAVHGNCGARSGGFLGGMRCTRVGNHEQPHIAHGTSAGRPNEADVLKVWL